MNIERRGSGEPIILIHGIGSRWQAFEPILDQLAEDHTVIGVDLPGFGASPLVEDVTCSVPGFADYLERWLAANGIERPHVVGNSMGGGIALELGRRGLARSVTAFAPVGFWGRPGEAWTRLLVGALRAFSSDLRPVARAATRFVPTRLVILSPIFARPWKLTLAEAMGHVDGIMDATGFDEALANFKDFRNDPNDGALADIPVTIAWGPWDGVLLYPLQHRKARTLLPFARHITLNGCGHVPFSDDPEQCVDAVISTVSRAAPGVRAQA